MAKCRKRTKKNCYVRTMCFTREKYSEVATTGVSRQSIVKHMKAKFNANNGASTKKAFKDLVASKILVPKELAILGKSMPSTAAKFHPATIPHRIKLRMWQIPWILRMREIRLQAL